MEIIRTHNISKNFGETQAVEQVSLHVNEGEIYGFVGLNGAGKTTTIRMLLGMIGPTSGEAFLFGLKVGSSNDLWQDVGYLVETAHAYPNLSVYENLRLYQRLRNLPDRHCVDRVMDLLQLGKYRKIKSRHLSTGNQQRLGLAKAIMHEPRLLLLDEPVNGLDPSGIVEIRELLHELSHKGTTVFLSSHLLSEVALLVHKLGIIHEGKLIRELQKEELETRLQKKLIIDTRDNARAAEILNRENYEVLLNSKGKLESIEKKSVNGPESISALLAESQLPAREIFLFEENLEDYFLHLITHENSA